MPLRTNSKIKGPKIKPQPKFTFETCTFKIDTATHVRLKGYCEFIGSEQSYVIREALNYLFESDPAFQTFFDSGEVKTDADNAVVIIAARAGV